MIMVMCFVFVYEDDVCVSVEECNKRKLEICFLK